MSYLILLPVYLDRMTSTSYQLGNWLSLKLPQTSINRKMTQKLVLIV
jgi:hypothetical protein